MPLRTPAPLMTPAGRTKLIEDGRYATDLADFRKAEDTQRWILHWEIPDGAKEPADRSADALVRSTGEGTR